MSNVVSQVSLPKDPICGMDVETSRAKYSQTYAGITYYFCSKSCFDQFSADPREALSHAQPPQQAKPAQSTAWPPEQMEGLQRADFLVLGMMGTHCQTIIEKAVGE